MSSLVERDVILRMIQQLAALLARVLRLKLEGRSQAASALVGEAYRALFGLDRRFLQMMQPVQVAQVLGHPKKIEAFAHLMHEEADLLRLQGDPASAASTAQWAVRILEAGKVPLDEPEQQMLRTRLGKLAALPVPV